MQRSTISLAAPLATAAVLLLTGCSSPDNIDFGDGSGSGTATSSSATPSIDPTVAAQQAVLAAYTTYWATYDKQAAAASSDKAAVTAALRSVAMDPVLTTAADDVVNAALVGQRGYGNYVVHPKTPVLQDESNTEAMVEDCIDSSQSGWEKVSTGQKLTVGVPAVYSKSTVVKGTDGVWRVSDVTFNDKVTCTP